MLWLNWLRSPNALRTLCRSQKPAFPRSEKPKLQLTPCGHVCRTWQFRTWQVQMGNTIDWWYHNIVCRWVAPLEFNLEDMNSTELHAGVFDGLEHLWKLSLKGNRLRTLPEGLFRNLSSLSILDLQGNCLRTLPGGLFRHLSSLRDLYLQNNGLEELPSSVWAWNHVDKVFCLFDFQRKASLLLLFKWL